MRKGIEPAKGIARLAGRAGGPGAARAPLPQRLGLRVTGRVTQGVFE